MSKLSEIELSVLDLSPVVQGSDVSQSFENSLTLARRAEELGYKRFWLAEHHNLPGIGSSATSVLIGYIAGGTKKIRVGSGGIMLPNHAPLIVAEQFGTLETLYPGRIDLGLGRAPGTDPVTARALRRETKIGGMEFPELLEELRFFLSKAEPGQRVRAVPGSGLDIPIWLLGSSLYSADLAGRLGLPFSFAAHFAPDYMMHAIEIYRKVFQPSGILEKPYVMIGVSVFAADTDVEAEKLSTSQILGFLNLIKGNPLPLGPPVDDLSKHVSETEKAAVAERLRASMSGSPSTLKDKLNGFLSKTDADELIVNTMVYDFGARLRSYEILSELRK
ncbi:LLM class flavin-dependent oxidoreductase [Leptospira gomenensis]|uniref:Luciferase-like monooxygenase n=1 Tax=Leptospira gomenensis TaxID=2484974 RepID=A0A5F1YXD0_9LEPT|nr:LLM class flavin-dependent oxidoreductase [Leptospira gomenensis]TGK29445.1 LLM class flavin-dependent oxidoreductase [Leptospira gomenensis]TGK33652.1 LLM class flavin-dependent oxidoreductase [Leptospira gomenensis]TGK44893.1 LLM class flavin-dependent oxidoreductase [Leptospira gomenensis]TGK64514.1 LLM class flavin-dependent oxidoreductase [Leptospira gomenensis]